MRYKLLRLGGAGLVALLLAACSGSDGKDGTNGKDVDPATVNSLQSQISALAQAADPEQCVLCHTGNDPVARSGSMHQTTYNEFYQDGFMQVVAASMGIAVTTTTVADDTTVLTFKLTKKDATGTPQPFDCTKLTTSESATSDFTIGSYWSQYDSATRRFPTDLSLAPTTAAQVANAGSGTVDGTRTYNAGTGVCTFTKTFTAAADLAKLQSIKAEIAPTAGQDGIIQLYGVDEILESQASHMNNGKYPFAGVLKLGTVNYTSLANVSGCENCHTQPFLKHAYIYGTVLENATSTPTQFYTCKGCHYDTRGGHVQTWQILKDNPARAAEIAAGSALTADEHTKYDYNARLMNDVHMSHNMEFPYPQTMLNCVTCHAGSLDPNPAGTGIFAAANFTAETCISCHSLTDPDNEASGAKRGLGLVTMMAAVPSTPHASILADTTYATLRATTCTTCHDGTVAPTFAQFHNGGYDPVIYAWDKTTGTATRYSDTYVVTIDSASISGNTLTIGFSATESPDLADYAVSDITPTVLVGLYGYDTKDFIVAAHGSDANGNRLLEWKYGTTNPRFTGTNPAAGQWQVTVDLSMWADMITAGTVKRAEISVLPEIGHKTLTTVDRQGNPVPVALGLNAPSKTFNFSKNAFENYFSDIVQVAATTRADGRKTGCNTCHDQLATTFHSGIRGGNIRVCRTCHEVSNPAFHLELQSRSIDSYVHAIHSFQAFDTGSINFNDPVQAMEYADHTEMVFPRFNIQDCESCHKPGMYDVPNQAKSMPGVVSGTVTNSTWTRTIGSYPPSVTGPAVRACGGCHRAHSITEDNGTDLAVVMSHWKKFGYVVDASTDSAQQRTLWETIVANIMGLFN